MLNGDKIYVEDLRVKATIGIFDWEKKIKHISIDPPDRTAGEVFTAKSCD